MSTFPEPVTGKIGVLTELLSKAQYPYLDNDLPEGTLVFEFIGETFGCISPAGLACSTEPNSYPFTEIPLGSVRWD